MEVHYLTKPNVTTEQGRKRDDTRLPLLPTPISRTIFRPHTDSTRWSGRNWSRGNKYSNYHPRHFWAEEAHLRLHWPQFISWWLSRQSKWDSEQGCNKIKLTPAFLSAELKLLHLSHTYVYVSKSDTILFCFFTVTELLSSCRSFSSRDCKMKTS
jgi:hypothetical protein